MPLIAIPHWLVIHLLLSYSYWTIIPISLYKWLQDYTLVILTFSILGAVNVHKSTHFHFIPDYRAVSQQLLSDNHCTSLYLYSAHL